MPYTCEYSMYILLIIPCICQKRIWILNKNLRLLKSYYGYSYNAKNLLAVREYLNLHGSNSTNSNRNSFMLISSQFLSATPFFNCRASLNRLQSVMNIQNRQHGMLTRSKIRSLSHIDFLWISAPSLLVSTWCSEICCESLFILLWALLKRMRCTFHLRVLPLIRKFVHSFILQGVKRAFHRYPYHKKP